jgi:hypothetical protein
MHIALQRKHDKTQEQMRIMTTNASSFNPHKNK